jgi:hypothetical protein
MAEVDHTNPPDPGDGRPTTGWKVIAGAPSVVELVDTLLDLPEHREFNKSELAELADVSRRSAQSYVGTLHEIGLVTEVEGTNPQRYRVNTDSDVAEYLIKLDGAINRRGPARKDN